ncbi:MAG: hypothetical protein EOP84_19070 [Verrucomicrobiaceae bacterium]|nr:MAG: hypothetical protein EOP84_19070 [Verrucomicrobiaceae bacterium]
MKRRIAAEALKPSCGHQISGGIPRLLLKTQDACVVLGGIHPRTLARMEERGLIKSLPLLRHKMYLYSDLEALVDQLREWNSKGKEAA